MFLPIDDGLITLLPVADVWFAFRESNAAGKIIVCALFIGSIFAWSIMVTKYAELRKALRMSDLFVDSFRKEPHLINLFLKKRHFPASPLFKIYQAGCVSIADELEWRQDRPNSLFDEDLNAEDQRLTHRQVEAVEIAADTTMADQMLLLESYMGFLATSVSASPFLGLLGTVWGVMAAFSGMAEAGSSTLSAVAPGIAGALLTTVVGLLVALPSSIGYNILTARIRELQVQMENYTQAFMAEVKRTYQAD